MKYRIGFVTNSSSSSYIVAHKLKESQKDLPEVIKSVYDAVVNPFFSDVARTEKEVQRFVMDNFGYSSMDEVLEDDETKKYYKEFLKLLKNGYFISCIDVGYYDDYLKYLLDALEEKGCVKIITVL